MTGNMQMLGPTGHTDSFARDNLPPLSQWPENDCRTLRYDPSPTRPFPAGRQSRRIWRSRSTNSCSRLEERLPSPLREPTGHNHYASFRQYPQHCCLIGLDCVA